MIRIAGRFITPVATTCPAASLTSTPGAAVRAGGTLMPKSCNTLTAYPDQPTATVEADRPYSSTSRIPMTQAAISPMDA